MPDWIVWLVIGIVGLIALVALIVIIIKIAKLPADKRKELLIDFLIGLVTAAESAYVEHGKGKEKIKNVEEAFKRKAPWFLKIILAITKTADLDDLIEQALIKAKETWTK